MRDCELKKKKDGESFRLFWPANNRAFVLAVRGVWWAARWGGLASAVRKSVWRGEVRCALVNQVASQPQHILWERVGGRGPRGHIKQWLFVVNKVRAACRGLNLLLLLSFSLSHFLSPPPSLSLAPTPWDLIQQGCESRLSVKQIHAGLFLRAFHLYAQAHELGTSSHKERNHVDKM